MIAFVLLGCCPTPGENTPADLILQATPFCSYKAESKCYQPIDGNRKENLLGPLSGVLYYFSPFWLRNFDQSIASYFVLSPPQVISFSLLLSLHLILFIFLWYGSCATLKL